MIEETRRSRAARRYVRNLHETDDDLLHARLVNWARTYRDHHPGGGAAGLTPDELDAEVIERALLRLKQWRPKIYSVVWQVYMARRDDVTGAQICRCSVTTYKQRLHRAYAYLHGILDDRRL